MQRKSTRGPNAAEKRFQAWTKEQPCIVCGGRPVIVHNIYGGCHWAVIPLCQPHNDVVTRDPRRVFEDAIGPQSGLWLRHIERSRIQPPADVVAAIECWGE